MPVAKALLHDLADIFIRPSPWACSMCIFAFIQASVEVRVVWVRNEKHIGCVPKLSLRVFECAMQRVYRCFGW